MTLEYIKGIEEKQFVKTVEEYTRRADEQNRPLFTDFFNKEWMESLLKQYVQKPGFMVYTFFGGYENAERQQLSISPYQISPELFEMGVLKIEVKTGLGKQLSHRDYLGAILGLGIERSMIGDIILADFGAYVIAKSPMIAYIRSQLTSIGRFQKIEIQEIDFKDLQVSPPQIKSVCTTVSALRADAVLAAMFGLSRSEGAKLIQGDKARRNGLAITSASEVIKEGDTLTLRGHGKAQLVAVNGHTKKDRLHITIEKYV